MAHLPISSRRLLAFALAANASPILALSGCGGSQDDEHALSRHEGASTGTGLSGQYFNNSDFTSPVVTRTDATINFNWGSGAPTPAMGADTFSVRWTGLVEPRYSETYTFYTRSDDGVRLWVDGKAIVNNWTAHAPTENSGPIALVAGKLYPIKMEYFESGGGAVAQLRWSSASQAKEIVPSTQLYTTAPTTCADLTGLALSSSPVDGANVAANVLDNDFGTRWSSLGKGAWIQADLGATKSVCSVAIAWHKGNVRKSNFQIALSNDGTAFTTAFSGQSSGTSTGLETYALAGASARYVRVIVNGNTENDWASIAELRVVGGGAGSPAPAPTPTPTTPPPPPPAPGCAAPTATEANTGPTSPCTKVHQGNLDVTQPNTVIEGYCIEDGAIIIGPNATNVVVRNTEIRGVGFAGGFYSSNNDLRGLTVEDTYIDCQLGGGSSGIWGSNWTGQRLEIRNCENGINIGSNMVLRNSLIHMPKNDGGAHADGIQIYAASHDDLIECNVIHFPLSSSSIQFHTASGTQNHDITVRYNKFLGGAAVVRVPGDNPSCQSPNYCGPWDNLQFYGNRIDLTNPAQEWFLCSGDPNSIEVWGDPTGQHPENKNVVDSTGVVIPSCVGDV